MRIVALLTFLILIPALLFGQTAHKFYLNKREITGPSLYCLLPSSIDSVKSYTNLEARRKFKIDPGTADSVHIVFMKDVSGIVSYKELLSLYKFDIAAMDYEVGISSYPNIEDKEKLVLSTSYISGVSIRGWNSKKQFFVDIEIPFRIGWPEYKNEDIMIPLLRAINNEGFDEVRRNKNRR
ncbi:hypothetical protein ACXZ1K_13825 [Pedobacter sp. PWIIR3]